MTVSFINLSMKIQELSEITEEEVIKAVKNLNIDPEFYIYKILFQQQPFSVLKSNFSENDYLNYYKYIIKILINLYPSYYFIEDLELYAQFALIIKLFSSNDFHDQITLDKLFNIFNMLDKDIEPNTIKWLIKEMIQHYILRFYIFRPEYYSNIKPLVDHLLQTEDQFFSLIKYLDSTEGSYE